METSSVNETMITAANTGTVIFADDLGIYGQCVLMDHGLGLTTLYAHLSRIDVAVGDELQQGQPVARHVGLVAPGQLLDHLDEHAQRAVLVEVSVFGLLEHPQTVLADDLVIDDAGLLERGRQGLL